jgi:predicted nucleic acid-binding protein
MTMAANRLFIDTNILVSAIVPESPRYFHAQGVLERVAASDFETWISRQVLREFLSSMSRHYTTPRRFSTPELLAAAGQLEQQYFVAEDHGLVTQQLLFLLDKVPSGGKQIHDANIVLDKVPSGGKQIHDANIVATMLAYDIPQLLTYNHDDFQRFAGFVRFSDSV